MSRKDRTMGSLVIAECPCGFKSDQLHIRTGMFCYDKVWIEPAVCLSCGILFIGNIKSKKFIRCPKCRKKAIICTPSSSGYIEIDDPLNSDSFPDDDEDISEPDIFYLCPKCKQRNMHFLDVGLWD